MAAKEKQSKETEMKKLGLVLIGVLLVSGLAFAAADGPTNSATFGIDAQIQSLLNVSATSVFSSGSPLVLDPAGHATADILASVITLKSNRVSWVVGLSSESSGNLINGSLKIPYGILITGSFKGGTAFSMFDTTGTKGSWGSTVITYTAASKTTPAGDTFNAYINYAEDDGTNWKDGVHYTDTVHLSVTAN